VEDRKYSLKELRARKNVTQVETAKAIGISVPAYIAWEKDASNVGISNIYALAEYFQVDIKEIKLRG
jgi:transcriptional regulator with XRE-family HTH domain